MTNQELEEELVKAQAEITRLKQEATQQTSDETMFRAVLDASPVAHSLNDKQQNIIYVNTAFVNTFGYALSDIATLKDWWPKAYPDKDYREKVIKTWTQHIQDSERKNTAFKTFDVRICCKDGSYKNIMAGASSLKGALNGTELVTLYDVSEIKDTERKLNQTVALLENVINSTPDLIIVKNKQLQTILCNEACARAVGKSREEMYGKTDIENGWDPKLVKGDPEKGIRGFIHDDLDALSGKDVHNPNDLANVDGNVRIFDTHKRPLKDADNNILGLFLIARDVTERKKAETRLQESEHRFRSIVESIDDIAVQGYDQERRVIFWNKASTSLYGYTKEEALGKKLEDLIIPDELRNIVVTAVDQFINHDVAIPAGELILRNKQGQAVPVYSSHTLQLTHEGKAELYCLDVSTAQLKQTQKELEQVNAELDATLRAIPDLLFELDEDGRYINLWAHDTALLASEKQALLGYTVNDKLPADAASIVMSALQEATQSGYSQGKIISLSLPVGKHWFELSIAKKPDNKGKKHFIVLSRDITERINTEEQLRRSQKMDALGKLTGGIAHDFNNMLNVILGYGELLQGETDDATPSAKYIKQIIMAGNRARSLTSKLLAFSRKQPAEKKLWDINEILHEDRHMLEKSLTARVELSLKQQTDLWLTNIDRDTFSDAILNICINAMHAMPKGGKLSIETRNKILPDASSAALSIPAGEYIQISLSDTGTGIPAEIKEKIFEPFFTTKDSEGTGLGLSQVYGFVKQSRGDIQVYSEPGNGTQIVIHLPRQTTDSTDISKTIGHTESVESSQSETLLIVDDEPALRELAAEILELNNYRVFQAEDAEQALHILHTEKINLMLTDVIMPGMNGYQLAAKVSEQYPAIKIIIASGYNNEVNTHDAKNARYQYLDKPYRSSDLLQIIRLLLD